MERKIINYTIRYFERGVDKSKLIRISRISRDTMQAYGDIIADIQRGVTLQEEEDKIIKKMAEIIISRDRKLREKRDLCKPLKKRLDQINADKPKNDTAFKSCVSVVGMVCEDNGITDKDLISAKFWSKKTQAADIWDFLSAIVFKDVEPCANSNIAVDDDMLFAALYKYYGPITNEKIGKMDLIEFQRAVDVCIKGGMPQAVVESIWQKRGDKGYLEMMMPRKDK